MRRLLSASVLIVVLVMVMAACTKNAETGGSAEGGKAEAGGLKKVTISIRENTWGARKDNFIEAQKRLNEQLKSEGTEVVLDWWPGIGDDELILQAQAGKKADIFINSSVDIGWQLNAGLIRDIDWVADSAVFKDAPKSYTDIMKYDGHYYGVIQDMDASPVFISRKALEGLGWTAEQIDGLRAKVDKGEFTFSDLVDLADQAMQKKLVNLGFTVEDIRFEGWKYAFGYDTYDPEQNKLVFSPKIKDVYSFWQDAFNRKVITEGIADIDTEKVAPKFIKGEVFAEFARTEFYQMLREANGKKDDIAGFDKWFAENVVWIPIPSAEKGHAPVSYSNPALIFVGSEVKDDKMPYVQQLIERALDPDLQINHTLASGKLPVTPEAQKDERFQSMNFYKDHAYLIEFTKTRAPHPDYATFVSGYTIGIESILAKGKTAEEAYELSKKEIQQNVPQDSFITK